MFGLSPPGAGTVTVAPLKMPAAVPLIARSLLVQLERRFGIWISGDPKTLTTENLELFGDEYAPLYAYNPRLRDLVKDVFILEGRGKGAYEDDTKTMHLFGSGPGGTLVKGTVTHESGHALHSAFPRWHERLNAAMVNVLQVYPSHEANQDSYEAAAEWVRFGVGIDGVGTDRPTTAFPEEAWSILKEQIPLRADWRSRILPQAVVTSSPKMPPLSEKPIGPKPDRRSTKS